MNLSSRTSKLVPRGIGLLRAQLRRTYSSRLFFYLLWFANHSFLRVGTRASKARVRGERVCVIPPPGDGNIGDQALFESVLWNTRGPVAVYVRSLDDFFLPEWVEDGRVQWIVSPHLLYSAGIRHGLAMWRLGAAAKTYSAVYVVGADVMDGAYNPRASLNRWCVAGALGAAGVCAIVLGFSWNGAPTRSSLLALRKVSPSCEVWVRDPTSFARVLDDGVTTARLCADIVFRHPVAPESGLVSPAKSEGTRACGPKFAVINMSALLKKEDHQLVQYAHIVDAALAIGWEVILLPHVRRPGNDDSERLEKLAAKYGDRVTLVSKRLTPTEVFELTSRAEFVVTGRMHLAILATLSGVPAVTLGSQGKVDGLYASLGKDSWAIDPASDFGIYVAEIAREVSRGSGVVDRNSVANLTELAGLPFRSECVASRTRANRPNASA